MSIEDYSNVFVLGFNCMPTHQLTRVAKIRAIPKARFSGPLNWIGATIEQAMAVIADDFDSFFLPQRTEIQGTTLVSHGTTDEAWKIKDHRGVRSWHHLRKHAHDKAPTAEAWDRFRHHVDERVMTWKRAVKDPDASLLFLRSEDPLLVDTPEAVRALAELLSQRVKARFRLASICFDRELEVAHPNVKAFSIQRTWPADLDLDSVDWTHDYGWGRAWEGHDPSWDRIFDLV